MTPSKMTNTHRRSSTLGVLAGAVVEELRGIIKSFTAYADDPKKHALSPRLTNLQNATTFCGYWSVASYLGSSAELALKIESEPPEVAGPDEFKSRVVTLQTAIKALGLYLTDVSKGVNANNSTLNECFRNVVRKVRASLLELPPQEVEQLFFMAVPLSLEIEAQWQPAPGASREALLAAIAATPVAAGEFQQIIRANPYPSLSGYFEGIQSQRALFNDPNVVEDIRSYFERLSAMLSKREPLSPPWPPSFLLSRCLWSAAHDLTGDEESERFRKRYALLNPAVVKAQDGVVSMHGLAKSFSKSLQDLCDAYVQSSVMRQTAQIEQMAAILTRESHRLGLDAFDQLAIAFGRAVDYIVAIEKLDAERRAAETDPEKRDAVLPTPEVANAWIRGAELLTLIKQVVETWHLEESQSDMLQIASRVNWDGVIGVSTTMQQQSRDAAVGRVMASLLKDFGTLKASIENAMKNAEGQSLDEAKAQRTAELIGRPSAALFDQASGVLAVLGIKQGSVTAHRILGEITKADTWKRNESRMALFDQIARFSVFLGRLRPGALHDLEPEEMGLDQFDGMTFPADMPSMGIFEMEAEEVVLGTDFADATNQIDMPVEDEAGDSTAAEPVVLDAGLTLVPVNESESLKLAPAVLDGELAADASDDDAPVTAVTDGPAIETPSAAVISADPVDVEDKAARMLDFFLSADDEGVGDELSTHSADISPASDADAIAHDELIPAPEEGGQPEQPAEQARELVEVPDADLLSAGDPAEPIEQNESVDAAPFILAATPQHDTQETHPEAGEPVAEAEDAAGQGVGLETAWFSETVQPVDAAQELSQAAAAQPESEPEPQDQTQFQAEEVGFASFASLMGASRRGLDALKAAFEASLTEVKDELREIDAELGTIMGEESTRCVQSLEQDMAAFAGADEEERLELLASIKRDIHTLKGVCRTCGLMRAGNVFHVMEDELELLGDDAEHFQATMAAYADAIRTAQDLLDAFISGVITTGATQAQLPEPAMEPDSADLIARALTLPAVALDQAAMDDIDLQAAQLLAAQESNEHEGATEAAPDSSLMSSTQAMISAAPLEAAKPKADTSVRLPMGVVSQVGAATGGVLAAERRLSESLDRARKVARGLEENIQRMSASIREIEIMAAARIAASSVAGSAAGDFDPLELDRYTALQEVVRSLTETHRDVLADIEALKAELDEVGRDESDLHEVSDELQRESSGMMLMPLAVQSVRLGSVVQRAAADAAKQVDLVIERDCRVPSAAVDKLMPVFEHLLRNSVAHGIEADRAAAGKAAAGRITIGMSRTVAEVAGMVSISVRDDGAGINVARVLELAHQRGLAKPGRNYSVSDVHEFIFMPGFSTASTVTQLSGRGVGLDVVRDAVSRIGGVIGLESHSGRGTEFTISLPTDAATMAVLPVQQAKTELLVPVSIIREVLPLDAMSSERLRQRDGVFELDGKVLEIVDLGAKLPHEEVPGMGAAHKAGYLVVMREGNGTKAVRVQGVKAQLRVSVTPLGPYVRAIPGFVAGTIGQGGRVSLIVNPLRMSSVDDETTDTQAPKKRQTCLMVVDDSPSMRLVTERAVRRLGFATVSCNDGLDALRRLSTGVQVDGFLVDLEMPGMDGFALIAELRRQAAHAQTPIIVISSRTAQKHQDKAHQLGANEYMTKPYDDPSFERLVAKHFSVETACA